MLPGMDVDIEFNMMFPVLTPGVIVHVHDIFLPYDYPVRWGSRMYSEQNGLIGWLCAGYFDVLYPGHFASQQHDGAWRMLAQELEFLTNPSAGSMWLERG